MVSDGKKPQETWPYISINNRRHRRLMMMMNEQANLELKINSLSLSAQFQFSPVHSRDDDLFFKQSQVSLVSIEKNV